MDYDKEQAAREASAFQHSTAGLVMRERHDAAQAQCIRQVFNMGTSIANILSNPSDVAEAVARWQGIEAQKRLIDKIKEEGKRDDG